MDQAPRAKKRVFEVGLDSQTRVATGGFEVGYFWPFKANHTLVHRQFNLFFILYGKSAKPR
jgi:hypothetical protein